MRLGEITAFQRERNLQRLLNGLLCMKTNCAFIDLRVGSELPGDLQVSRSPACQ